MNCPNCGATAQNEDLFCGECGTKLQNDFTEPTNKNSSQNDNDDKIQNFKKSMNDYTSDTLSESKRFFGNVFTGLDNEIASKYVYSYKLLMSLVGGGLIILLLFSLFLVPGEVAYLGITKSSIIFKILIYSLIALLILFGITIGIMKILNIKEDVHKILSDFIAFNTYAVIFILLGLLFILIKVASFAAFLIVIGILLFVVSPIYLISKYSNYNKLRIPTIYGIIVYFIILAIITRIIVESSISGSLNLIQTLVGG
ncbi:MULTISPECIES: zinc ribbon domain-containing protein [Staphylococcus]|uniref:zinc ribbon domain-containing protein n=1 Tax=Staphylococcus TaxID=1279 RepID=UPI002407B47F|nr:zinc ribbon domain-containing protein [Staphylococcus equorum]MDG0825890.1 zinc ribbon domain-containing protein [Staphylococcus equorum]